MMWVSPFCGTTKGMCTTIGGNGTAMDDDEAAVHQLIQSAKTRGGKDDDNSNKNWREAGLVIAVPPQNNLNPARTSADHKSN